MAKVGGQGGFYRCVLGKNAIINSRCQGAKILCLVLARHIGYNMLKECRESKVGERYGKVAG